MGIHHALLAPLVINAKFVRMVELVVFEHQLRKVQLLKHKLNLKWYIILLDDVRYNKKGNSMFSHCRVKRFFTGNKEVKFNKE